MGSGDQIELNGKFKITGGAEWNEALRDKTSPQYKDMSTKMNNTIAKTLKKSSAGDGFLKVSNIDFTKGSVEVNYVATFRPDTVIELDNIDNTFRNEIANGTAFAGFTVDPNSVSFTVITPSSAWTSPTTAPSGASTTPSSVLLPTWAIGVIIASAILVIFIVIILIVICCTASKKRKQKSYYVPHTADTPIKEEGARYTFDAETSGRYVVYVEKQPIGDERHPDIRPAGDTPTKKSLQSFANSHDGRNNVDLERNNSSSSASTLLARPIARMPSPEGQDNNAVGELIDMNEIYVVDETKNSLKPLDVSVQPSTSSGSSGKLTSL